jgi:medium-chain acyl-[acyl-carrier-protein] hydrolase
MGAMLGFEVARRLRELGEVQPDHLFVSARQAPQLANAKEPLRFLTNQAFIDKLHALYGAVPEAIRQNAELQNVFLPILRADVALLETHPYIPGEPLRCPITVFGGEQDPHISAAMLFAWKEQTDADFSQHSFPGDHFYIASAKESVARVITRQML